MRQADIVVAAVGRPQMIRGDWIKPGATVIDVGINRLPAGDGGKGKLVGDVAFVELVDEVEKCCLARVGRQPVLEALHADFERRLVLGADIDLACGIGTHQHHGKARREAVLLLDLVDFQRHGRAQVGRDRLAVDAARGHGRRAFIAA